ncbi:PREDICTED: G-protein coupled bile acid receptor 1 isoform X2 [Thamnophis sirtalis]|uniref:G-protein coupled bile acid receptor 1 isoform X2 n=1 Tax=Thamnophis sirtalis TaxID=35019 RepID=A0A6I9YDM4_9SAUR|nr:PREDICTED: G-protein coupled bile acid receptor 1 isoform X2 [Thamnophis sirtalis]
MTNSGCDQQGVKRTKINGCFSPIFQTETPKDAMSDDVIHRIPVAPRLAKELLQPQVMPWKSPPHANFLTPFLATDLFLHC